MSLKCVGSCVAKRVAKRLAKCLAWCVVGCFVGCVALSACGDPRAPQATGPSHGIALLHSDYQSTVLSLADPHLKTIPAPSCVHSGSARGPLSFGLSGDVVMPSEPWPDGCVTLIDRAHQTLVWVDPRVCRVVRQVSIAMGFAANPQDAVAIAADKAYVTRHQRNLRPGRLPYDAGDDVLVIDPKTGVARSSIDLQPYATPGFWARPARMQRIGEHVYVSLLNMSDDFARTAIGRVAVIDTHSDTVVDAWDVPVGRNCFDMQHQQASGTLAIACMGQRGDPHAASTLWVRPAAAATAPTSPVASVAMRAWSPPQAMGGEHRLGMFGTAWLDPATLLVVTTDQERDHTVSQIAPCSESVLPVLPNVRGAWETLLVDDQQALWLSDATRRAPRLLRLMRDATGTWQPSNTWDDAIGHGLPVRQMALY